MIHACFTFSSCRPIAPASDCAAKENFSKIRKDPPAGIKCGVAKDLKVRKQRAENVRALLSLCFRDEITADIC